jgi:3-hydroxyacyl-CoA dehydrogenase
MAAKSRPADFRKAAVLGAGVMGRAIAAHLANAGLEVLLLDLPAAETTPDSPERERNRLLHEAIKALPKDRPSPIFSKASLGRISVGNFEDDLTRLSDVDWVIEAVVERFEIKEKLFSAIAPHFGETAILSSNTSGIPIARLAETVPEKMRGRFLGTHFFNPPRYMHLLELIAGPATDPAVLEAMIEAGEHLLGKGVVVAKDRPNFVANRVGTYAVLRAVELMLEQDLNPTEVDFLTGPLIGRPKSATFRTVDLVGLDTLLHVAGNITEGAPEDPAVATFEPLPVLTTMVEKGMIGSKAGQGFYRMLKGPKGKTLEALDLANFEYAPKPKARFAEIDAIRPLDELDDRLHALFKAKGRGADYIWATTRDTLWYAATVASEIADDLVSIDRALRWGFGWKLGPFELWETLGLKRVAERMQADGLEIPEWVAHHIEGGATGFFEDTPEGRFERAMDGPGTRPSPQRSGVLELRETPTGPVRIDSNAGATLWDLGDDVMGLEFHTKMNSVGGDIIQMAMRGIARTEREFAGMVVGNHGEHFSAGANLALLLMAAIEGEFDEIDIMVRQFQGMTTGLRRCARPVVVAPFGLTLGGGCEITLHGDAVTASAELYCGLVEAGVGVIPAGGGTKELYLRMLDRHEQNPRKAARAAFEVIGMAKVSMSGLEARDLGFLRDSDPVVLNADHLIDAAKRRVLALNAAGYVPPLPRDKIPVGGDDTIALVEVGLRNFQSGQYISEHDALIGRKLGHILSGGAHRSGPSPRFVSEQHMLDLEREAFLSLCGERKSLERIQQMLKTGKPLRN